MQLTIPYYIIKTQNKQKLTFMPNVGDTIELRSICNSFVHDEKLTIHCANFQSENSYLKIDNLCDIIMKNILATPIRIEFLWNIRPISVTLIPTNEKERVKVYDINHCFPYD